MRLVQKKIIVKKIHHKRRKDKCKPNNAKSIMNAST